MGIFSRLFERFGRACIASCSLLDWGVRFLSEMIVSPMYLHDSAGRMKGIALLHFGASYTTLF